MSSSTQLSWSVIVPVKSTARGKSRIALSPAHRQVLAAAMAFDTVSVASRTPGVGRVLVMVENAEDAALFATSPGPALVQAQLCVVDGLNEAIIQGRELLVDGGPVAVLPGDLPGILVAELQLALAAAAHERTAVVADADGVGTTLLTASEARHLRPQFGGASFARHLAAGSVPIDLPDGCGLRRDIDRLSDLIQALHGGGLGDRTAVELVRILEQDGHWDRGEYATG